MYESPILITKAIEQFTRRTNEVAENQIFEAVLKVGVEVNREELIKALQYDRDQYDIGYEDGFRDGKNEVVQSEGEWNENIIGFCNVCMSCGVIVERIAIKNTSGKLNYCPNCGLKMKGDKG
jgi:hypothetical protein